MDLAVLRIRIEAGYALRRNRARAGGKGIRKREKRLAVLKRS